MSISWVEPDTPLPNPVTATPSGLVAAGGDLSAARLDEAYHKGLFPWFSPGDPILWWSPDPRMVLRCADLHVSRSLAKRIRQFGRATSRPALQVTLNSAFPEVIAHCAQRGAPRIGVGAAHLGLTQIWTEQAEGTWITPDIVAAYGQWHQQGRVQSIETWIDGQLAGGLYGVSLGRCFFGESMFSLVADTSKVALAYLVNYLRRWDVSWIDCQQETPHLASLGARPIPRQDFLAELAAGVNQPSPPWGRGRLMPDGTLISEAEVRHP
ncbi:MAG TPA: leucyl/phenylalanyl-tRNA--protein transferase [Castellaniella sp.]|uniref:leucyl/phenylalanyl-tRNA--protein transferase n=1 Tax=Castellaniella sp. TaxID=1955812 RepID=UPI002F254AE2